MSTKLYVGNLSFQTSETELKSLFDEHGTVVSVKIVMDPATGRSRGFGFVEMEAGDQADSAISALDGKDAFGRNLRVNLAKEREPGSGPRFGGGRGGNGGGGFRGNREGGGGGNRGGFGGGRGGNGGGGRGGNRGGFGGGRGGFGGDDE